MILLTGASSYLGARLYDELRDSNVVERGRRVVGTYNTTKLCDDFVHMDLRNKDSVEDVVRRYKPHTIIHAAAISSASQCEKNEDDARDVNLTGTQHVIDAAERHGADLVYISTFAAALSNKLYGQSKLNAEIFVGDSDTRHLILRPSMIFGGSANTTNDRPHNRLLANLEGKTAPIYEHTSGYQPTWIGHISAVLETCLDRNIWFETIPIACPEMRTRYEIARDILAPFGVTAIPDGTPEKGEPISLEKLEELDLPTLGNDDFTQCVIEEIRWKECFKL